MANIYGFSQNGGNNNVFGYRVPNPADAVTVSGDQLVTGKKTLSNSLNAFNGNGSALTSLPIPTNLVTLDSAQTITAAKTFNADIVANGALTIPQGPILGRNDTGANTFYGTCPYPTQPIGWTISTTKTFTPAASGAFQEVLASLPNPNINAFNNLSNGVWRISILCNNTSQSVTSSAFYYGPIIGGVAMNGTVGSILSGATIYSSSSFLPNALPELIIRTTGNGITGLSIYAQLVYTISSPTLLLTVWMTKIA